MTPGSFRVPIFKGAKWEFNFLFKVAGTDTPVDLTNLGPFVATIKHPQRKNLVLQGVVTSSYDATGTVNIKFSADQTVQLPLGDAMFGVRDAYNNPYIQAKVPVEFFSPTPS